jgi:diguanylate cyclase (GGDEF)-like protein
VTAAGDPLPPDLLGAPSTGPMRQAEASRPEADAASLVRQALEAARPLSADDLAWATPSERPRHRAGSPADGRRAGLPRALAAAPLPGDPGPRGALVVTHASPRAWTRGELETLSTLAAHAGVAMRNARDLERMSSWTSQLQSIQQLGARLARLSTIAEIGAAICLELREVIDCHDVRVYRVLGDEVVPVAWRAEVGEYSEEDGERLRLRLGEGITGWVAQQGVAQYLPDAAADPRAATIPGTAEDLDESMLLAPMRWDEQVLGVIVLSRLGLDRFEADDLRCLEIYASMAAQAVVNADTAEQLRAQSERLERQLETQRELILVTESILSSLDRRTVVAQIADRLGSLVPVDTLGLDLYDADSGTLTPLYAQGVDAPRYLGRTLRDSEGVAGWVARHGEPQLVPDELSDPRVAHFDDGPSPGALIVAPLHGRGGVAGVLTLERLGATARFEPWEFELVTLFAAHVSIALANAARHEAVERLARTDALTGLKNQGTFSEDLARAVGRGSAFTLLILDLDDFKVFNDAHGHEAGNALLASIARGLRSACRDTDEVYRYGGDEFALILPGSGTAGGREVALRVARAVRTASADGVSCSVGIAAFPGDASDRDQLLLAADRACYVAKRSGRGRIATADEACLLDAALRPPPPTPVDELRREDAAG